MATNETGLVPGRRYFGGLAGAIVLVDARFGVGRAREARGKRRTVRASEPNGRDGLGVELVLVQVTTAGDAVDVLRMLMFARRGSSWAFAKGLLPLTARQAFLSFGHGAAL